VDCYDGVIEAALRVESEADIVCQIGSSGASREVQLAAELLDKWSSSRRVMLIQGYLPTDDYDALVRSCDVVVLPYDPDQYSSGSSGVMFDALTAGAVVVATPFRWARSEFPQHPNVVWLTGRAGPQLESAIALAVDRARVLRGAPTADTSSWKAFPDAWRRIVADALVSCDATASNQQPAR
jgi:hypothetical protein